jgi:ubiquinone/menaquinone biosynthesis C-methylase UbiE
MAVDAGAYLASGFRDVDTSSEVGKFVSCLRFMDELSSFQDYKQESIRRAGIAQGMSVLDVGCGVGSDVARISALVGGGHVIGLDPSAALVAAARQVTAALERDATFVRAVGERLPFRDESFDVCRVDRTLQHVADPQAVIADMCRVLKPGGRVVCAEPDWGTFVITSRDRATTRSVAEKWCDGFRNEWIGRFLQPSLRRAGFADVTVTGHLLIAEGFMAIDKVFDVAMTVSRMGDDHPGQTRLGKWLAALRDDDDSLASVTLFLATGVKPLVARS